MTDSVTTPATPAMRPPRASKAPVQAVIRRSVLDEIRAHGQGAPDVEVCGVLVGNVYRDGASPFVYVDASIRGNGAHGKAAQVTFTAETWTHIQNVMEKKHSDERIVGWYHTHPGFGIFLSEMDLFIQRNFFPEPWQVAFVFDPKSEEKGLFLWREGKLVKESFSIDDDKPPADAGASGLETRGAPTSHTVAELSARLQALEKRQRWLIAALLALALLALIWPLVLFVLLP